MSIVHTYAPDARERLAGHHGNRKKDLVDNVERYAALGIAEYLVFDRRDEKIHGHRLPSPDARRYQRIVPQRGRHASSVLGLGDTTAPAHYDVVPDWVCEVISPRTERVDRAKKMRIYRREGVRHAWLLNPLLRTLEVYRLDGGHWVLLETYEDDARVRVEPFDAVEIDLASVWSR